MTMKPDQERIHSLLVDTISLLCRNGLNFKNEVRVQAVIGIKVDKDECFVVHINKCFERLGEEKCENEEQLKKSALQIAAAATAATAQPTDEAPPSASAELLQTTQQPPSASNLQPCTSKLQPSASEQNKSQLEQGPVSATNAEQDDSATKCEIQVAKSGSAFDDCAEFDASRTRVNKRRGPANVQSDECDDSSVITTDSLVYQQRSRNGEMYGKQRAANGHDMQQPYYKSSRPTRHKPRHSVDGYQPKTKKRNLCEDLFDTDDDCHDEFSVGQQYMYIDAGKLRSRPKSSKQQQQQDVFFDPECMLHGHLRVFTFTAVYCKDWDV